MFSLEIQGEEESLMDMLCRRRHEARSERHCFLTNKIIPNELLFVAAVFRLLL